MKRLLPLILTACLLFTGCSNWLDGNYLHITPHDDKSEQHTPQSKTVADYGELCDALSDMVDSCLESGIIFVPEYDQQTLGSDIRNAVALITKQNPIAAYAVGNIQCEMGTNSGQNAISVKITYHYDEKEIRKIQRIANMEEGKAAIEKALTNCDDSVVLYFQKYQDMDFVQFVEDYSDANPRAVMETPQVKANIYPDTGAVRVVELKFTYQNSRESLRDLQRQVDRVFESARLYFSDDSSDTEKYEQLYSFLMKRHDYTVETSITPSYSLLHHGKGDAKAFATVYAAMCREAGLQCTVITGTRWGEAWYWNLICDEDVWYHIDLLRCNQEGAFLQRVDLDMEGYVWDYSAYPESQRLPEVIPDNTAGDTTVPTTGEVIPPETTGIPGEN